MEQRSGKSARVLCAGYEAGSCERTGDSPETQEEPKEKLLYKNQAGESSISDKMMTADDTLSEEGVQDQLSGTSLIPKSFFNLLQKLMKSSRLNQLLNRSPVYGSNTYDEAVERRAVPSSVYCDPDIKQLNINSCGPSYSKFLGLGNRHVVLQRSRLQSITWYDTAASALMTPPRYDFMSPSDGHPLYPAKHHLAAHGSTHRSGERLTQGECGIPLQSERTPGGKFSAVQELLPPVTARNYSTEDSLLVNSQLQQPSDSFRSGIEVCYLPSDREPSLRQIALALLEMEKENVRKKKHDKDSPGVASTVDSSDYTLNHPPPGPLRETGLIKTPSTAADVTSGHSRDNTRETELHATAGPSTLQPFTKDDDDSDSAEDERVDSPLSTVCGLSMMPDQEYGGDLPPEITQCLLDSGVLNQFSPPQDTDDDCITCKYVSTVCTAGRRENVNELLSVPSECEAGSDGDALEPGSSCLPRSHSVPSLSQISCAENKTFRPSQSLPDMLLKSSFEEFTPDITVDDNDETYRFLCSCPGLYQCSVTGLVFHMEGEGDVVYRIVSWDRRLLAQHHKKPAGPLFDIKCLQQSVCRLHLPHCEIPSTAGCEFLSVAHLHDEGIEFIPPHKITETHVIINISGFSGFGNVKDEDSPPEPVRALVLLFYRPADDPDLESQLSVLMLPGNVSVRNVQRTRKSLVGDELYIGTSPYCELLPKQEYTLSTCPEDDSVLVQPTSTEFHCDNYENYFTSFEVDLEKLLKHIKLFLRDTNKHSVWERRVCLSSAGLTKSCRQSALNLPSNEKLFDIRSSFIEGISGPVLKSLLDKLFKKKVLIDSERESADEMQNREDKARFVIDTVRRKGEAASSEMIEFLCEVDPFLSEHLGLM